MGGLHADAGATGGDIGANAPAHEAVGGESSRPPLGPRESGAGTRLTSCAPPLGERESGGGGSANWPISAAG